MPNADSNTRFSFRVEKNAKTVEVTFARKDLCDAFGSLNFYSQLLHSLRPNDVGEWVRSESPRVKAYIVAWPPNLAWIRIGARKFTANIEKITDKDCLIAGISKALVGMAGEKLSSASLMGSQYTFTIRYKDKNYVYKFSGRAREVCALCVLWDLEPHPRNHLEVITQVAPQNVWPIKKSVGSTIRIYGDPSKTVDELRNQGFPRETDLKSGVDSASLKIDRRNYLGSKQEHYQLLDREQRIAFQVGRSQIPASIRTALYKEFNFVCAVCQQAFEPSYLAPDHRIPAIVQSDDLTKENYSQKLQVLCRSCNQVKREVCKKCPFDRKCVTCTWAYPERHSIGPTARHRIYELANEHNVSPDSVVKVALELYQAKCKKI